MDINIEDQKKKLEEEIKKLRHEYEVELPKEIGKAREFGDLKENSEYHAARDRMSMVSAKIAQLSDRLSKLNSLDINKLSQDAVGFGSKVIINEVGGDMEMEFVFVSPSEVDPMKGFISLVTPYGKALADKKVGDIVEVSLPAGKKKFKITYLKTVQGNEYKTEK